MGIPSLFNSSINSFQTNRHICTALLIVLIVAEIYMYINERLFLNTLLGLQVLKVVYVAIPIIYATIALFADWHGKHEYIKRIGFIFIVW
jgi:hypothetical protein